ncbi:3-methyladenine DNA glycosylase [Arcobacter sp. 31_11_sub10_T18]|nr:3-methyladenine DNA glycosylase [Arcobacter sp. 31_11_sub10_T18]
MNDSYDLFVFLKNKNLLENSPEFWWPSYGTFETFIGAILTQNTKWTNVEKSLENLHKHDLVSLEKIANVDLLLFTQLITPSGFKNQKSKRLKQLCQNVIEDFDNFESFQNEVCREWLLEQKGIGPESADAILCYACKQEEFVVDSYANRLLKKFGYEFESYEDLKSWLEFGINENLDKITRFYEFDISLNQIYCRLHGKIVEFMKNKHDID